MKLRRSNDDRIIAGVCSGIGNALDIPPRKIRIAFILFILFGGLSVVSYLVAWIVIPNE